jgi:parvulin-like peptidyl-prolyl isomerase
MKNHLVLAAALLALGACGKQEAVPPAPAPGGASSGGARPAKMPNGEPAVVTVEHILISFEGAGTKAKRSKQEAQKLAYETINRTKQGEDFTKLRKEISDDNASPDAGIYTLVNTGVAAEKGEFERNGMVPAFGNVGFVINVNEIGLAEFDPAKSPYGWHIIKRLK